MSVEERRLPGRKIKKSIVEDISVDLKNWPHKEGVGEVVLGRGTKRQRHGAYIGKCVSCVLNSVLSAFTNILTVPIQ